MHHPCCAIDINGLLAALGDRRVGVVTTPAGWIDGRGHLLDVLIESGVRVTACFAPEHGLYGELQAGVHVSTYTDTRTGLPVFSLYGEHRVPPSEWLDGVDVIVFHAQDATCRYYTFKTTLWHVMQGAAAAGKPVVVLDRPTPLGGARVEGNVASSIYFPLPLPTRYGMTLGELARMLVGEGVVDVELTVLPVLGWQREYLYPATGMLWTMPSPNLPTIDSVLAFPATGILEGTTLSEGRGTTRPFEIIGAPWVDPFVLARRLNAADLPGALWRPVYFVPTFSKHRDERCGGVQLHISDAETWHPTHAGIALLQILRELHPEQDFIRAESLDMRFGTSEVRCALESGCSADEIVDSWQPALREFAARRRPWLLYPEQAA